MDQPTGPEICLIAALEETSRVIGANNQLIWKLEGDLPCFKELTINQTVIMGRRTYESLGSKPLPERHNIVVSSRQNLYVPGGGVTKSFMSALRLGRAMGSERICFIGGEKIFEAAIPFADTLYLTLVSDPKAKGDVYFPFYENFGEVVSEEKHPEHRPPFRFLTLKRKTAT